MLPYPIDIEPGDKELAVNGIPVDDYIESKSKIISASTNFALKSKTASALHALDKYVKAPASNLGFTIEKYKDKQPGKSIISE